MVNLVKVKIVSDLKLTLQAYSKELSAINHKLQQHI